MGIVFLVFGVINLIVSLIPSVSLSSVSPVVGYIILGLMFVFAILGCFYFFGFVKMGRVVDSKMLRVSAIMNIVSVVLGIFFFVVAILLSLFGSEVLSYSLDGVPITGDVVGTSMLVVLVIILLYLFVARFSFSLSLIRIREKIRFSLVAGIFGMMILFLGIGVTSFVAYIVINPEVLLALFTSAPWMLLVIRWIGPVFSVLSLLSLLFEMLALFDGAKKFES